MSCFVIALAGITGQQKKTLSTGDQIQQEVSGDSTLGGFHVFEFHKGSADMLTKILLLIAVLVLAYLWVRRRYKKARNQLVQHHPMMGEVAQALTQVIEAQRLGPAYPMAVLPRRTGRRNDDDEDDDDEVARRFNRS